MADKAIIRISASGVARTQRRLSRAEQELQEDLARTLRELEQGVLAIFRQEATGGPAGRLARGLQVRRERRIDRPGFVIESTFRSEGFDPLPVTRFGHRKAIIRPRADRAPASVVATHARRGPHKSTQTALALRDSQGRRIFRHYVKGYKPPYDWVVRARESSAPLFRDASERLGRRVTSTLRAR